jgi:membrane protein DedA with SNARE-associated domain
LHILHSLIYDLDIFSGFLPYGLLWLATFFEGPLTLLAAGAGIALGQLQALPAFLAVVCGNLCADMGWYGLGRFGKKEWLEWIMKKLRIDVRSIERLEEDIRHYAPRLLFLSKLTVGLPIPTLITVGLNRVPIRRWILPLVMGELLKSTVFVCAGYLYAEGIQQTYGVLQTVLWIVTLILLVVVVVCFRLRRKVKQS